VFKRLGRPPTALGFCFEPACSRELCYMPAFAHNHTRGVCQDVNSTPHSACTPAEYHEMPAGADQWALTLQPSACQDAMGPPQAPPPCFPARSTPQASGHPTKQCHPPWVHGGKLMLNLCKLNMASLAVDRICGCRSCTNAPVRP
jgi:hypothetical protein